MRIVEVANVKIGPEAPLAIIAGPCLAESLDLCLGIGASLRDRCESLGLGYVFKASFDKANRSSIQSDRGLGLDEGLKLLEQVRGKLGVPVTTDIHEPVQAAPTAQAVDLVQIPAYLSRQTDLLVAAAATGTPVNVKKGQFLSPQEMSSVVQKLTANGGAKAGLLLTERGTFFGYQRLVNDFLGLGDLMTLGWPVCFDATHSTQLPGAVQAQAMTSGGRPDRAGLLARAAVAAGVQAVFLETHPDPSGALSDGATMLPLEASLILLAQLQKLHGCLGNSGIILENLSG